MVTPGERSNASICADFPASALLLFDCDPQSAQISPEGAATGMGARFDAARRANHSTGTKICLEANSYCQKSRLVEVQIGA
jgi:hypothetical protein